MKCISKLLHQVHGTFDSTIPQTELITYSVYIHDGTDEQVEERKMSEKESKTIFMIYLLLTESAVSDTASKVIHAFSLHYIVQHSLP